MTMKWEVANAVVEQLRRMQDLFLPALTERRGFSSSRVEHLLNCLVAHLPSGECYLEVGTLEGRTLDAAAHHNTDKHIYGCDPGSKYGMNPREFAHNVRFFPLPWQDVLDRLHYPIGLALYDGDHSAEATQEFMDNVQSYLAREAVLVLDDWDRISVRAGAWESRGWTLLREMPEYTDGLTCPPNHFGYYFGTAVWGYKRA